MKTCSEDTKKRDARKRLFVHVGWLGLEVETQTDEEALRLGRDVVAVLFLVNQTEAIAGKQLGSIEFKGGTKHQVDIEWVQATVVAIPFGGGGAAADGALRCARYSKAEHGADERRDGEVAVDADAIVEEHRDVKEHLGFFG